MVIAIVDAGDIVDSKAVPWCFADFDVIAGLECALLHYAHIAPRPIGRRERCWKSRVFQAEPELEARHPRFAHLEDYVTHSPMLPDYRCSDVNALSREIVAKHAGRESAPELSAPPLVVLRGIGVDRLVDPAVDPSIRLFVADEIDAFHPHRAFNGILEDPGGYGVVPEFDEPELADVDRDDSAHAGRIRNGAAKADGVTPPGGLGLWLPGPSGEPSIGLVSSCEA